MKPIRMIFDNYCTISNGYYVEKGVPNTEFADGEDISQYTGLISKTDERTFGGRRVL